MADQLWEFAADSTDLELRTEVARDLLEFVRNEQPGAPIRLSGRDPDTQALEGDVLMGAAGHIFGTLLCDILVRGVTYIRARHHVGVTAKSPEGVTTPAEAALTAQPPPATPS